VASDVVGDDVAVVGAGPTVGPWSFDSLAQDEPADTEALHEADMEVLLQARAARAADILAARLGEIPPAVRAVLDAPRAGGHLSPRRRDRVRCIAGVADLARAAAAAASTRGIPARIWAGDLAGDVADVARRAVEALDTSAGLLVASGETTLRLPERPGQGGRARHLALLLAKALAGRAGVTCLVAGSDGVDGTGPAAGAVVDGTTWARIAAAGLDGDAALAACDSGRVLAAIGADVTTGPTGVNHADLLLLHAA